MFRQMWGFTYYIPKLAKPNLKNTTAAAADASSDSDINRFEKCCYKSPEDLKREKQIAQLKEETRKQEELERLEEERINKEEERARLEEEKTKKEEVACKARTAMWQAKVKAIEIEEERKFYANLLGPIDS